MKFKIIAKTLSILLILFSLAFIAPILTALYYKEPTGNEIDFIFIFKAYLIPFLITLSMGIIFWFISKKSPEYVSERDALAIVSIGWLLIAFLGALPYVTSETLSENDPHENMIDAYFESMSGFTTTGATILDSSTVSTIDESNASYLFSMELIYKDNLSDGQVNENIISLFNSNSYKLSNKSEISNTNGTAWVIVDSKNVDSKKKEITWVIIDDIKKYGIEDNDTELYIYVIDEGIENCEKSILLWRSLTQWLGGMGIIVLSVVILARIMGGGTQLFKAEISGTTLHRLKPEIAKTAAILWKLYTGFTIIQIILLRIAGMTLFDSINHSFCAIATGGFGTKNASVGYYDSVWIEAIMIIFMVIGATSFILIYHALTGKVKKLFKDQEFRLYMFFIFFTTFLISYNLWKEKIFGSASSSFRGAIFQVVSIHTASGFATEDFVQWPAASQLILFILMFIGGCVASTAGGIKVVRILVLLKAVKREVLKMIHPRAVIPLRLGETKIKEDVVKGIGVFFFLYICIFAISTVAMTFLDLDIISGASAVASTMGTVGPGLGTLGPSTTFAAIAPVGKVWLSMCMLFGRLELFAILILFFPSTYK